MRNQSTVIEVTPEGRVTEFTTPKNTFVQRGAVAYASTIRSGSKQRSSSRNLFSSTTAYTTNNNSIFYADGKKLKIANKISFTVDKNTTDAELDKIKKILKDSYNVTVKFSNIKRNSDGEITEIKVDVESKSSSANFP